MKLRAIRSLRVAQAIMQRGQKPLKIEPSVKSAGKLVFVFEDTPIVKTALDESNTTSTA